ncbi:LisH domain-containing protein C29A3.03c [Golovinomyces cichoracearum]|uniref:GID complex catalytic subunit 2 n=1 Tax=Golovinomyces cichoracearum TaxID=62708 RepID=A0A420IWN7_9PEZI|nr:LisH domain-containing protein C29A3.03c [Golovinomyces cichoracearum]
MMDALETELAKLQKDTNLKKSVDDVDAIIEQLEKAREIIVADPNSAPITLATLQNPLKKGFDQINEDLNKVHRAYAKYGRALEKENFPIKSLPNDLDAVKSHNNLINRAIAMHFIREGQFSMARKFLSEGESTTRATLGKFISDPEELKVEDLLKAFLNMYSILEDLKVHNLHSAIDWARQNSLHLEQLGSNIEFELCKLQYLWLFHGPEVNGLPDDQNNGLIGAYKYARVNFPRHMTRFPREIQQLVTAMLYRTNIKQSPYHRLLSSESAWEKINHSFVRDFCSLLGLSPTSPLHIACTAGAIALPTLLKFADIVREKKTEWTTQSELPVEIPLPRSMFFHAIFVCPVSKEQTTENNPPMVMPCGHVLAKESLQRISKAGRCKCPYCPSEGLMRDAKEIVL